MPRAQVTATKDFIMNLAAGAGEDEASDAVIACEILGDVATLLVEEQRQNLVPYEAAENEAFQKHIAAGEVGVQLAQVATSFPVWKRRHARRPPMLRLIPFPANPNTPATRTRSRTSLMGGHEGGAIEQPRYPPITNESPLATLQALAERKPRLIRSIQCNNALRGPLETRNEERLARFQQTCRTSGYRAPETIQDMVDLLPVFNAPVPKAPGGSGVVLRKRKRGDEDEDGDRSQQPISGKRRLM